MAKKKSKSRLPSSPQLFKKYKIFKPENARNTLVRLEGFKGFKKYEKFEQKTARIAKKYENKNIFDNIIKKHYNFSVLNFRTKKDVCRDRENRKRDIMRITKGAGLRVHYARWTPDSFSFCVR